MRQPTERKWHSLRSGATSTMFLCFLWCACSRTLLHCSQFWLLYHQCVEWCGVVNNPSLNVSKTKDMMVDFWRSWISHAPLHTGGAAVETVSYFKFLGMHMTENIQSSLTTSSILKMAQKHRYFLRWLKRAGMCTPILNCFYRYVMETIMTCSITVWYINCSVSDRKVLQCVLSPLLGHVFLLSKTSTLSAVSERILA